MHLDHDHIGSGKEHTHTYTHAHSHAHSHDQGHEHEHTHSYTHTHDHGDEPHTHATPDAGDHEHAHSHHDHNHDYGHDHEHGQCDCDHGEGCQGSQCAGCAGGCQHTPMEELTALMKYMVGHNAAHAQELAALAKQLEQAGQQAAYEQVMLAVSDFEKGNLRLSAILQALA